MNRSPNGPPRIAVGNRVTISRRGKKGIWTAEFWQDGQHRRLSLRTAVKREALDRAAKLEHGLLHGTHRAVPHDAAVAPAVADYLTHLATEGRAPKTLVRYRGELERFRDFCAGHRVRRLGGITPSLFDRYRGLRRESIAARTLHHEGTAIKQFLKWCVSRRRLAASPLADVTLPEPPAVPRAAPALAEVRRILADCPPRRRATFALLAFTGMRSGELRQLRKRDVDLDGGWVHVVSRPDARTKTGASRKAPLHPCLRAALAAAPDAPGPWFFSAEPSGRYPEGGRCVNTKKLNERFLAGLRRLGPPAGRDADEGRTLHSLRRFFETHCVNAGVPQRVVDAWLGHKPDRSMASVCYRLSEEESRRFMDGLDFAL